MRRHARKAATFFLILLASGAAAVEAQYDYGGSGYGGSDERGYFAFLEGSLANPRNTDNVVATAIGIPVTPLIPEWDDDVAGRLGVGYRWGRGNRVVLSFWSFETDQRAAANSGFFAFPIGPTFTDGGSVLGDSGSLFDITTEISAEIVDLAWTHSQQATDALTLDWTAGLRFAGFEETAEGNYQDGGVLLDASKRNDGEMFGFKAAVRGTYRLERYSFSAGLGLSFLDGELDARSGLKRSGQSAPESLALLTDDSRSGTIRDLEVAAAWHGSGDRVSIWFGWEQGTWDEIAADLMRNLPGGIVTLRERNSVTFSGYKLGIQVDF